MDTLIQPHVLVIDPDPSARVLLTAVLRRTGLRVTACDSDADAGEHCLRRSRYAVVILSTDMPSFDALLAEIAAPPEWQRPNIIVATTTESDLSMPHADVVLMKPFYMTDLYAAIAKCCTTCGDDRERRASPGSASAATAGERPA
ncbi:MAG TPA: response regulator [Thermoanaerobaculia bacterium]|jgi:DNA-binding response OmpR family regulator